MDKPQATERIAELRRELARHDYLYYVKARPEITDYEYDQLYQELQALEHRYPELTTADSPTRRVGGALQAGFVSRPHAVPMQSLDNTYSASEVENFDRRVGELLQKDRHVYTVEPKIDGVSISVRYEHGRLVQGLTRGNGIEGDDVTANLRTIRELPLTLPVSSPPAVFEARGEVFMAKAEFILLNQRRAANHESTFANPRNATAGSLKLLDPALAAQRPLHILFYGCGEILGLTLHSQSQLFEKLQSFRLPVPDWIKSVNGIRQALKAIQELAVERDRFTYEIDGAVLKIADFHERQRLGSTAKAPRWAIAYKFEAMRALSRVTAITVQVGRTGTLTPVAELEPTPLAGSTVSRATLHNFKELHRKDIRIGDRVEIEKAGDVIPAVVKSLPEARTGGEQEFSTPAGCPACGSQVSASTSEVAIRCVNPACPAQARERLRHFCSRGAMDIESIGEAMVELLINHDFVSSPVDLYYLQESDWRRLQTFPGLGSKSIERMRNAIERSKSNPPWRLLFGLGIRHVGSRAARTLLEHFDGLAELAAARREELQSIPELGPVMAESIVSFFENPANRQLLSRLGQAGVRLENTDDSGGSHQAHSVFTGKTCVLTGTLAEMSREQAAESLRQAGARVAGSVSSKTDLVIAGEKSGAKRRQAEQLGVRIIDEPEFIRLLAGVHPGNGQSRAADNNTVGPLRQDELF